MEHEALAGQMAARLQSAGVTRRARAAGRRCRDRDPHRRVGVERRSHRHRDPRSDRPDAADPGQRRPERPAARAVLGPGRPRRLIHAVRVGPASAVPHPLRSHGRRDMADGPDIDPTVPPSGTGCVECEERGGWWGAPAPVRPVRPRRLLRLQPPRSTRRHTTSRASGHPVMQSYEPGEDWFWDFERSVGVTPPPELPATRRAAPGRPARAPGPAGRVPEDWQQPHPTEGPPVASHRPASSPSAPHRTPTSSSTSVPAADPAGVAPRRGLREPRTTIGASTWWPAFGRSCGQRSPRTPRRAGVGGLQRAGRRPDGYMLPATQHDIVIWLTGARYDVVFDLSRAMSGARPARRPGARDGRLAVPPRPRPDRFIDGTENPTWSRRLASRSAGGIAGRGRLGPAAPAVGARRDGLGGAAGRRAGGGDRPPEARQRRARPEGRRLARRAHRPGPVRQDLPAQHRLRLARPPRHDLRGVLRRPADPRRRCSRAWSGSAADRPTS